MRAVFPEWVTYSEERKYGAWSLYVDLGGELNYSEFCDALEAQHA